MKLITIIGTALTICLITIVLATEQIQLVDTRTEPYRSRTLYVPYMNIKYQDNFNNGYVALSTVRELFLKMKTPEAVAAYMPANNTNMKGLTTGTFNLKICNDAYFHLYKLQFIAGRPCSEDQSRKEVLLTESACKALLGTIHDAIGKTIQVKKIPYRVCGIVKDVTPTNREAAADAWIGYNFQKGSRVLDVVDDDKAVKKPFFTLDNFLFNVNILLHNNQDEAAVRKEMESRTAQLQKRYPGYTIFFNGEPERRDHYIHHNYSNQLPDMNYIRRQQLIIYLILLIVPALNLMNIAMSNFSRQENDISLLRAFGASRNYILWKTLKQGLLLTFSGGALGLLITILLCKLFPELIFFQSRVDFPDILHLQMILSTLLFCLLLNLLSTLLPAWWISRKSIYSNI